MTARAFLRRSGRALIRPAVMLTILAIVLVLFIWFVGPLIGFGEVRPLAPTSVRLALVLLVVLAWGIAGYFTRVKRSSEEKALLSALRKQHEEKETAVDRDATAAEVEFRRFRDAARAALRFLRKGRGGPFAGAGDALPWYVVLGEAGSGKSLLARAMAPSLATQGAVDEGAQLAGFHISDEAVLVELEGDLVAQSGARAARLWPRILDHLRRLRPRQPVNGVVLAIGADRLLAMPAEEALDLAVTVRRRLDEVSTRLRTRAPVYLVVTKLDLLPGFEEFFETLSAEERNGAFGFPVMAIDGSAPQPPTVLEIGFADLVERLAERVTMRLQEEPDELRRRRLVEFPGQFALLRARLQPLVDTISTAHRFGTPPMLRGLFFVSAMQTGALVDVTSASLAPAFAHRADGLAMRGEPVAGRSRAFFLRGLLRDVMLADRALGGFTRPARMMARAQGVAANVAMALVTLVLIGFWWAAFAEGRAYTARLEAHAAAARVSVAEAAPGGERPARFEPVLRVLDDLRALVLEEPRRATLGLYGTANVEEASRDVYERALSSLALPFVWRYLETGLDDPRTPAALRFQQLKFYLMLAGERPVAADTARLVAPDFAAHWLLYDRTEEVDRRVANHFAELADVTIETPRADLALIDRARARISDYTLARLGYDTALSLRAVQQLPVWRPVDHMGLAGPQALSRVSGASFWDGVRGIFTRSGFNDVMLRASGTAADAVAADLWVMAMADTLIDREREARRIRDGLLDLYRVDYITQWDGLLSDLDLIATTSAGELARAMALVVGQPSPVKQLTAAIALETDLAQGQNPLLDAVPDASTRLQQIDSTVLAPRRVIDVAGAVSEHFRAFREAVLTDEGEQAQIDAMLSAMEPLYRQINHVATGGDVLELGTDPQSILAQLTEQTGALPQSLQPLFRRILNRAAAVTSGSSRERLAEIWTSTVLPLCRATTQERYPFVPSSTRDASIADFASLFAPSGAIASFRNDYLRPFVDSSAKPWRWRTGQQFGLDLDDAVLRQFERADEITTAYFGEADQPSVAFTIEPIQLDQRARAFQLDIGGPTLVYAHGPPAAAPFVWPTADPTAEAMLSVTPELDGERNMLRRQGAWALFRLFDAGRIVAPDATDIVPYQFNIGSRALRLAVTAPPTRNPFARDILSAFECPVL